ncbi:hypothetical protein FNH08_35875 [Streptomyces spongiae]|uniref:Uncharacterized protein n=1 Tax=Streptomyces spongiae TaxID=565072 RepID=A0A5N8XSK2_9ACTN|nr:hypothetical protein [Streptomyces spongiae]
MGRASTERGSSGAWRGSRWLGDPRHRATDAFLSLRNILPTRYPLDGVELADVLEAENFLGHLFDYGVILPRARSQFGSWAARSRWSRSGTGVADGSGMVGPRRLVGALGLRRPEHRPDRADALPARDVRHVGRTALHHRHGHLLGPHHSESASEGGPVRCPHRSLPALRRPPFVGSALLAADLGPAARSATHSFRP